MFLSRQNGQTFRRHMPRVGILLLVAGFVLLAGCRETPEARTARFMKSGKEFMAKNDPERAVLDFRNAAQATPNNPDILHQLALALIATGDYRQGINALRRVLAIDPKHAGAQVAMSRLMVQTEDVELIKEAKERLQEIIAEGTTDPEALQVLGLSEMKLGEPEDAAEHLEAALAKAPQNLLVAVTLARVKLSQNDPKGAEEVIKKATAAAPQSAEAANVLGQLYMSLRQYDEAEQQFRRASSLDKNNKSALLNLALLQNSVGRKKDAEETLKQLASFPDPDQKSYHAIFLAQEGRLPEALAEFEAIHKAYPENRSARTRLVSAYNRVGRTADARKVLDEALSKNERDADALVQRAELLVADKKFDQAEADLNEVLRLQPNSAELHYAAARLQLAKGTALLYRQELNKAIELNPYLLPARVELADHLTAIGQAKAAMELIEKAPDSQKENIALLVQKNWANWATGDFAAMRKGIDTGLISRRTSDLLLQDGLLKLRTGNLAGGRTALEEALKLQPNDIRALSALSNSYASQKQTQAALAKVKEYAAQQPKSAAVQNFYGMMLMAQGSKKEAREAFELARKANPSDTDSVMLLIQSDVLDQNWDSARKSLGEILKKGENATARLWLGNIEEALGNHALALEHYQKAVDANPNDPQALNNLAYLLWFQGKNVDQALKYAEKASELNPNDLDTKDTLGWLLYNKGSYSMAVKHLEVAAKSSNPIPKYHLAMAYAKAGDSVKARVTFAAALKANDRLPEAKEAKELLDK